MNIKISATTIKEFGAFVMATVLLMPVTIFLQMFLLLCGFSIIKSMSLIVIASMVVLLFGFIWHVNVPYLLRKFSKGDTKNRELGA